MYVCICKAVTDSQLRTAINNGICTRRQLVECFGVGKECGKCNQEVTGFLQQSSHQASIYPMMAMATH
jgi:bacterioferritin-associated ferredoxin